MIEEEYVSIKYPSTHGLDGKVHNITIERAVQLKGGNYYVEGYEYDGSRKKKVVLDLAYSESDKKWYKNPHDSIDYARLSAEAMTILFKRQISGSKVDDTAFLREQLNGAQITNTDEKKYRYSIIVLNHPNGRKYIYYGSAYSLGFVTDKKYRYDHPRDTTHLTAPVVNEGTILLRYYPLTPEQYSYICANFNVHSLNIIVRSNDDRKKDEPVRNNFTLHDVVQKNKKDKKTLMLDKIAQLREKYITDARSSLIEQKRAYLYNLVSCLSKIRSNFIATLDYERTESLLNKIETLYERLNRNDFVLGDIEKLERLIDPEKKDLKLRVISKTDGNSQMSDFENEKRETYDRLKSALYERDKSDEELVTMLSSIHSTYLAFKPEDRDYEVITTLKKGMDAYDSLKRNPNNTLPRTRIKICDNNLKKILEERKKPENQIDEVNPYKKEAKRLYLKATEVCTSRKEALQRENMDAIVIISHRRLLNTVYNRIQSINSEIFTKSMLEDFQEIFNMIVNSVSSCYRQILSGDVLGAKENYETLAEEVKSSRLS